MKHLTLLFLISTFIGCSKLGNIADSSALVSLPDTVGVAITPATVAQCANGGSVMELFKDKNTNGVLDADETIISTTPVCNGANGSNGTNGAMGLTGANGTNGISAGIQVVAAAVGSCPAGGTVINTFQDLNSNGVLDAGETIASTSTICNGVNGNNGTDGKNAVITSSAATLAQCSNGGVVFSTYIDGQTPQNSIVCNGTNAVFEMGAVGQPVAGQSYTACHHDYLYIPNGANANLGWLIFRHQKNGSADQGIGSTGFNLWDVDIADFLLASEQGGVNYCSLHWDPTTRLLTYTVIDNSDGHQGENGSIQF